MHPTRGAPDRTGSIVSRCLTRAQWVGLAARLATHEHRSDECFLWPRGRWRAAPLGTIRIYRHCSFSKRVSFLNIRDFCAFSRDFYLALKVITGHKRFMDEKKKGIRAWVTEEVYNDFAEVCAASHLEPTKVAALLISRYSQIKKGALLDVIQSMPKYLFKPEIQKQIPNH